MTEDTTKKSKYLVRLCVFVPEYQTGVMEGDNTDDIMNQLHEGVNPDVEYEVESIELIDEDKEPQQLTLDLKDDESLQQDNNSNVIQFPTSKSIH